MKRFTEQLESKANAIKLSMAEKNDLRDRLVSYIEYHPLPLPLKEDRQVGSGAVVTPVQLIRVNLWRVLQWSAATFVVLIVSVSYLAERAVPGDALYAIKVSVNEEVRGTLARSSYEKVVWETERLNRRIAEARLLASEGRLTEAVETEVAAAVKEHNDNARREIENLKQTDREEAALATIQLETTIEVQAAAFKNEANDISIATAVVPAEVVQSSILASALAETKQVGNVSSEEELPSYTRLVAHVERETTRAYELLKSIDSSATPEERSDITRRLEDINRAILEASLVEETDDVAARHGLVAALQRTQRLIVFMTNIDIRSEVTVEEIVPVMLTIEERNDGVRKVIEETEGLITRIEAALIVTTIPEELASKLLPALEESKLAASTTRAALPVTETEIEATEAAASSALAIAKDTATALGLSDKESEAGEVPPAPTVDTPSVVPDDTATTTTSTSTATSTDLFPEVSEEDIETGSSTTPTV
jgi:hypothetical protein